MEDKQENLKELEQKDMENVRGQIKLEKAIKSAQHPPNRSSKKKEEIKWKNILSDK